MVREEDQLCAIVGQGGFPQPKTTGKIFVSLIGGDNEVPWISRLGTVTGSVRPTGDPNQGAIGRGVVENRLER